MKKKPSETAKGAAFMRAAHLVIDGKPKIMEDHFALALLGPQYEKVLKENPDMSRTPEFTKTRAFVVLRNRYAEDQLFDAISRNIRQYVILGAGLDSFVLRRQDFAQTIHVFEVDLPSMQKWKQNRFSELHIKNPDNLTFVPIDFESQDLANELIRNGFQPEKPAFFSWLGVTQYLTKKAVYNTFHSISSFAAFESEIVFQYCVPEVMLSEEERTHHAFIKAWGEECKEPWLSLFEPEELILKLIDMGYHEITDLKVEDSIDLYFKDRTDGLLPPKTHRLMKASLAPRS